MKICSHCEIAFVLALILPILVDAFVQVDCEDLDRMDVVVTCYNLDHAVAVVVSVVLSLIKYIYI